MTASGFVKFGDNDSNLRTECPGGCPGCVKLKYGLYANK